MPESDFRLLNERALDRRLDSLESDVWAGIEARAKQTRARNTVFLWQSGAVAIALISAVALGNVAAKASVRESGALDAFSPLTGLVPSTLLLGHRT
jgi:hypothetical protein